MGGTTYVAIHDDLGVIYAELKCGNMTHRWCSFSDSFGKYAAAELRYPYTSNVWFTVPVSREVFEARLQAARQE